MARPVKAPFLRPAPEGSLTAPGVDGATPSSTPVQSALASRDGRTWLAIQLGIAELDLKQGPKQLGWSSNEALRPKITEHVEFLRALNVLVNLLPA